MSTEEHNPSTIINAANERLAANDFEGAQMVYQSALLDWVDDARENSMIQEDDTENGHHTNNNGYPWKEAITTLWLEYVNICKNADKPKLAIEIYESALNCPVAGPDNGRLWREYATYQVSREKFKNAQKIYLRALVGIMNAEGNTPIPAAVTDDEYVNLLWNDFLAMMKMLKGDESLSMDQLRRAVQNEHSSLLTKNSSNTNMNINMNVQMNPSSSTTNTILQQQQQQQYISVQKTGYDPNIITIDPPNQYQHTAPTIPSQNPTSAQAVQTSSHEILQLTHTIPPELKAEWLLRDGDAIPTTRPEPPLFTPSPPKLGDASGKDLLGTELALQLTRLLLKESNADYTPSAILDICKGCWLLTALKEKEAANTLNALDEHLMSGLDKLESELDARLSVAGAALAAVEQMNNSEKNDYVFKANQQRQHVLSSIVWDFRHVLAIQQQLLTNAGVPCFHGPTVDTTSLHIQANICAFLHSAFYLRNRIGEEQHLAMLKSQESRLTLMKPVPMPTPQFTSSVVNPPPPLPPPPGNPLFSVPPPDPNFLPPPPSSQPYPYMYHPQGSQSHTYPNIPQPYPTTMYGMPNTNPNPNPYG